MITQTSTNSVIKNFLVTGSFLDDLYKATAGTTTSAEQTPRGMRREEIPIV